MGLWHAIYGTMRSFFQIGGPSGPGLKRSSGELQVRNNIDNAFANLQVARATVDVHAATYLDVKERIFLIEFSFDGASPPTPGTNTGKYGICHTDGGSYSAGAIYLDTGAILADVVVYKRSVLMTTTTVTGTVSLVANGVYIAQSSVAPHAWTLKGDGSPASVGLVRSVQVNFTTASASSTTNIPTGSTVLRVYTNVASAFDTGTIAVKVGSLVVQSTDLNDPTTPGLYFNDSMASISSGDVVNVTISGGPISGAGSAVVEFVSSFLT